MGDNLHESKPIKPFIKLKNDVGSEDIDYFFFYRGIPEEFKYVALEELNETEENINGDNLYESVSTKPFIRLKNDVGSEDIHYSLFYRGIPEEFKDVALEELNETEENIAIGLLKLRDFLKDKGISGVEDYTLLTVLRNCKYNIENSEIKLMKYLQTQDMVTKRLQTVDLERLENVLNHRAIGFLPYRDKHGRAIIYTTPYDLNLESFDLDDAALCAFCILFYALNFPLTSVTGLAYIAENKYPSLSLCYPVIKAFKQYMPTVLTLPFRIAKIEMLNENFVIRWAYNLAKAVLASKITERVTFYGSNIQGLHKFYHPAILPEEFGGTMGPLNTKWFWEDFLIFVKKLKSRNLYLS